MTQGQRALIGVLIGVLVILALLLALQLLAGAPGHPIGPGMEH